MSKTPWYKDQPSKIFGIGLTKTGTMSLSMALTVLGYKSKHYPWSLEEIDEFDATTDIPVACRYKELDQMYPGSKFILTTRDPVDWINTTSLKPADPFKPPLWKIETRLRMYGCLHHNREKWSQAFEKHHREVKEYFTGRTDLLILPLEEPNKWEALCQFLEKPVPNQPYPWVNKTRRVQ